MPLYVLRRTPCYPQSSCKIARTSWTPVGAGTSPAVSRRAQQVGLWQVQVSAGRKIFIYHVYVCNDAHHHGGGGLDRELRILTRGIGDPRLAAVEHRLPHCGCRFLRKSLILLLSLPPSLFLRPSLCVCTASSSVMGADRKYCIPLRTKCWRNLDLFWYWHGPTVRNNEV